MKINIEPIKKKDAANIIAFDYEPEEADRAEFISILSAEKINSVKISGTAAQENGFAAVNYTIYADFTAECARCACETPQTIEFSGKKYFAEKTDGKEENEDYYTPETENTVDLHKFLTEFLSLEVPLRYLCSEECLGLCQFCGKDLNEGGCGCSKQNINPAFKLLDNFFD